MKRVLEDTFIGRTGSPSFDSGFRWQDSQRRVRVVFAGVTIADSTRVMLLHEFGYLPVFYFPLEDVRMDVMEQTQHSTDSPLKGKASYWTIRVGDRVAENAAWSYIKARHPTGLSELAIDSSKISFGAIANRCPHARKLLSIFAFSMRRWTRYTWMTSRHLYPGTIWSE